MVYSWVTPGMQIPNFFIPIEFHLYLVGQVCQDQLNTCLLWTLITLILLMKMTAHINPLCTRHIYLREMWSRKVINIQRICILADAHNCHIISHLGWGIRLDIIKYDISINYFCDLVINIIEYILNV